MNSVHWETYTSPELETLIQQEDPVVVVPVGAVEQHGTHLPVDTDTDIGREIALRGAEEATAPVLVLPSIWAGVSAHHMSFPGTISVRQQTLHRYVYDVIVSLDRHGVNSIVILNSHGGNRALLQTTVDTLGRKEDIFPFYLSYWSLLQEDIDEVRESDTGGVAHGGEMETSIKWAMNPQNVRQPLKDIYPEAPLGTRIDLFEPRPVGFYRPFEEYSSTGQLGAASLASRKKGEWILDRVSSRLAQFLEEVHRESS